MHEPSKIFNKNFILKSLMSLLIIVSGTFIGILMGNAFGLTGSAMSNVMTPEDIPNETTFVLEERFPEFDVLDKSNQTIPITSIIDNKKTLLCFVSNGCGACLQFVNALQDNDLISDKNTQIIFLTSDVQYFRENYNFQTYEISSDIIDKFNVYQMPTLIGIDEDKSIKFVHPGYNPSLNNSYVERYL